ncbi:hypothetical protein ACOBQJ_06610 [Pelotomaculum propionicicum]|uniref:hypothetical protein n=1 Tax=Pelotomaculum propionicicum TaxID=258475 RepID=UPI003B7F0951
MDWKISICEENCTGCRICQMICSWANQGRFNPSLAFITIESIDENDARFRVRFEPGCKNCGLCAAYCAGKALRKERGPRSV